MLHGWQHDQHRGLVAIGLPLASAEDALTVLPQDLELAISVSAEPIGWMHLPDPLSGRWPPMGYGNTRAISGLVESPAVVMVRLDRTIRRSTGVVDRWSGQAGP
jgi:hypothetical protein